MIEKFVGHDALSAALSEFTHSKYGPKYCEHCKSIQQIIVYELEGSQKFFMEGNTCIESFTGARVCNTCKHIINEAPTDTEAKDG